MRFEGRINPTSLARVTRAISTTPARVFTPMKREFERIGVQWQYNVGARLRSGKTGPTSLHSRSGFLAASLQHHVSGSSIDDLRLRCVSQGPNYARPQEYGADIKPTKAKYLTIPIGANLRQGSETARFATVGALISEVGKKRVAFVIKPGANKGVVLLRDATAVSTPGIAGTQKHKFAKGKSVAMFALSQHVVLPGPKTTGAPSRLGFFDEFKKLNAGRSVIDRVARELGRVSS